MAKMNCWEYKKCGREPGGAKIAELGICPVATENRINGLHQGKNGGRACWAISASLCGGVVQGSYAEKLGKCMECSFYKRVLKEELMGFHTGKEILQQLRTSPR